jgi:hypothetical protein
MGMFDWLSGSKSAPAVLPRQPVSLLREQMLAINRASAPFTIRDGAPEGVDLVAEWKIVDARWYEIFAKAGLEKTFKVLMKFDEAKGEVRSVDQEWTVAWRAGIPSLALAGSSFRGQKTEFSFGTAYAFKEEDLSFGKVYEYRFKTAEIKDPLIAAAQAAGWGWKAVAFGKL